MLYEWNNSTRLKMSDYSAPNSKLESTRIFVARLDPKISQLDSTFFDKFSTRSTPSICTCFNAKKHIAYKLLILNICF